MREIFIDFFLRSDCSCPASDVNSLSSPDKNGVCQTSEVVEEIVELTRIIRFWSLCLVDTSNERTSAAFVCVCVCVY